MMFFTDFYCQHRQSVPGRKSSTKADGGALSPAVFARLVSMFLPEDGGVGVSVHITVVYLPQIGDASFDDT